MYFLREIQTNNLLSKTVTMQRHLLWFSICVFFFIFLFFTRTEIVHGHGLNMHSDICLVLKGAVESPSGMAGKKAHTTAPECIVSIIQWDRIVSWWCIFVSRSLQLPYSKDGFYCNIVTQVDSNQSNAIPKSNTLRTAPHS